MDRSCRLKTSKGIAKLNIINRLDIIDIYRLLHPTTAEYTFFQAGANPFKDSLRFYQIIMYLFYLNSLRRFHHQLGILTAILNWSKLLHFNLSTRIKVTIINFRSNQLASVPFRNAFARYLFRLCWGFLAACGLSLAVMSEGYTSLWCTGFSLQWLLLLYSTCSRHMGASVMAARKLSRGGFQTLEHRLSSCGTFLDLGSNLCPLHWQADSYPLYHQGSPAFTLKRGN